MMNVLLIAYNFPPDAVVGSLRAAKVAEALRRAGHHVDVITARLPGEKGKIRVAEPGMTVHVVRSISHPRHLYVRAKKRFGRDSRTPGPSLASLADSAAEGKPGSQKARRVPAWKRYLVSALWIPDDMQGFIAPALLRSRSLFRRGVDLVYTTSPPHSDHLVGLLLKKIHGVKWVAEFRDPWTDCGIDPLWQSAGANHVNRWLERQCLGSADHVVTVSEGIAELLAPRLESAAAERLIVARSGIENLAPVATPPAHGRPFRIVYLGNLYKGRDPLPFLKAVAAVKDRHALGAADLQVEFIGACERFRGVSVRQLVDDLGISELVTLRGWVPHAEGQAALGQADLLLLLAQQQPKQIPNKLYEYLGTRKPILAIADDNGETARMLRTVGGQYVVADPGNGELERALESAMARGDRTGPPPVREETLAEWTTERQMQRLLQRIGALAPAAASPRRRAVAGR